LPKDLIPIPTINRSTQAPRTIPVLSAPLFAVHRLHLLLGYAVTWTPGKRWEKHCRERNLEAASHDCHSRRFLQSQVARCNRLFPARYDLEEKTSLAAGSPSDGQT
jgi:hypothetical protein